MKMLKSISKVYSRLCSKSLESELRQLSTAANLQPIERSNNFRCLESNPVNHTVDNIAQFYSLPKEDEKRLFSDAGLPKIFRTQCETFNETCIMIRKPAINVINALQNWDFNKPACRFVIYGVKGSGRSLSLAHVVHYGYRSGFLLVHIPWLGNWMRRCKESSNSVMEEGFTDLNIDAAMWLTHFKNQNAHLLKNENFKMSQDYIWNKREKTMQNAPLAELIEFGINRIKYASFCIVVLADEIKKLSNAGVCKTMVAVDGYNAFFHPNTRILKDKKVVSPDRVTLTKAFLNLSKCDWNNAAIVVTVDQLAVGESNSQSYLPKYLLGKDGFEHLDPFVPVSVENYNEKEFLSCVEYYKERKWIQNFYPGIVDELAFVSNSNPFKLTEIAAPL